MGRSQHVIRDCGRCKPLPPPPPRPPRSFLSLTDKSVLGEGDAAKLEIKVCQGMAACALMSSQTKKRC